MFINDMNKNFCRWYDESSAIKRAYDKGLIDKKWVENYCWNNGKNCVRKTRFEKEGYISPDYVLPDGTEDPKLKEIYSRNN
jgi:hypothetical protein